jgi:hypothetical protein
MVRRKSVAQIALNGLRILTTPARNSEEALM